jgi:site-specific recombinase XerD
MLCQIQIFSYLLSSLQMVCETRSMRTQTEIERRKNDFLRYIELERGLSSKTIENYDRYLSCFITHTKIKNVSEITNALVLKYGTWLTSKTVQVGTHCIKNKTKNYYLIALRIFLKFLQSKGFTTLNPKNITLSKVENFIPETLSKAELTKLLVSANGKDIKSLRDNALLWLLFSSGLKVSELCALQADIDLNSGDVIVQGRKGERVVFISPEARDAVQAYLHVRVDTGDALFVNNGKRFSGEGSTRLSPRSVQRIVKQYSKKSGIQKIVTPQRLRSAYALDMLENGADIESIQELLGHQHAGTTKFFIKKT